jgi:hypothetical protein
MMVSLSRRFQLCVRTLLLFSLEAQRPTTLGIFKSVRQWLGSYHGPFFDGFVRSVVFFLADW